MLSDPWDVEVCGRSVGISWIRGKVPSIQFATNWVDAKDKHLHLIKVYVVVLEGCWTQHRHKRNKNTDTQAQGEPIGSLSINIIVVKGDEVGSCWQLPMLALGHSLFVGKLLHSPCRPRLLGIQNARLISVSHLGLAWRSHP